MYLNVVWLGWYKTSSSTENKQPRKLKWEFWLPDKLKPKIEAYESKIEGETVPDKIKSELIRDKVKVKSILENTEINPLR